MIRLGWNSLITVLGACFGFAVWQDSLGVGLTLFLVLALFVGETK